MARSLLSLSLVNASVIANVQPQPRFMSCVMNSEQRRRALLGAPTELLLRDPFASRPTQSPGIGAIQHCGMVVSFTEGQNESS